MSIDTPESEKKKSRPNCPFYGFHLANNSMREGSLHNQCGLVTGSVSSCIMEYQKQKVCWEKCPYNAAEARKSISESLDKVTVFPEDLLNIHLNPEQ